jgi:hypothetical protein
MYWTVTDESEPLGSMPGNGAFHRKARKMRSDTNDTMRSPNKSFLDTCAPARSGYISILQVGLTRIDSKRPDFPKGRASPLWGWR